MDRAITESKKFMDYKSERMLEELRCLSEYRRKAKVLKDRIRRYETSRRFQQREKIKKVRRELKVNLVCQENARDGMDLYTLFHCKRPFKIRSYSREKRYLRYRKMQRPTRVQPKRGNGLIKRYF
jgi:hypothetical protein